MDYHDFLRVDGQAPGANFEENSGLKMHYKKLGRSDLSVSTLCLGTMTWGSQNTAADAFPQMAYALDKGVVFWDTAETYAVPPSADTYGATETIIGNWFAKNGQRDKVVLASKVVGRTPHLKPADAPAHHHDRGLWWIREGRACLDRANIVAALDASLKRLQTDYIDLYQIHWPDRPSPRFGVREFADVPDDMAPKGDYDMLMLETLNVMSELIKAGKIRAWGVSNETPWGLMKYLNLADKHNFIKPVSVQNPYSLLDRRDEGGMSELCVREDIAYLPYSPLGAGVLTGKYLNDQWPVGARATNAGKKGRYISTLCEKSVIQYVDLAEKYGLDPARMALAFCAHQEFVTSTIMGATSMAQLENNIASWNVELKPDILRAIAIIHSQNPNPAC